MITHFKGHYDFLSNFHSSKVTYAGVEYPTIEHAYQASKTLDTAQQEKIRLAESPAKAKKLGKRVTLRSDWDAVKVDIMRGLIEQKFKEGTGLAMALLWTGDEELVEKNWWGDDFWGVTYNGVGQNWLGKLLMERRKQLTYQEDI